MDTKLQNLLVKVLSDQRQLWQGSEEAPAVRAVASQLARDLAYEYPGFDRRQFLRDVGY